jgi:elongation factor 1-alpha
VSRFKAQILVVDHPNGFGERYAPYLHVHQAAMPCSVEQILSANDESGEPMVPEEGGNGRIRLINGCSATVWVRPHKPLVIEPASRFPRLGRFVLRDGRTVATGLCLEVEGTTPSP